MKKKQMIMIVAGLSISILAGCQKTPEDAIVKEKGASSIKKYQSTETKETSLRETIKAPERYTNKAKSHPAYNRKDSYPECREIPFFLFRG